jgi:hypothetical protein
MGATEVRMADRGTRKRRAGGPGWAKLPHEELLEIRLCDLGVRIEGTELEDRIGRLYDELEVRGLRLKPHCWLADEWFSPEGIPGIAIPFYLAHPRLTKLEERMMLEVEGGTKTWCMQLLRHEAGHAYETAYRLTRRPRWRQVFGDPKKPYPETYNPKPFSRKYVQHLDWWYAQSHPCEDFAETFAVWLRPGRRWRRRYGHWPAIRKLEYVDELMDDIAGKVPPVRSRARIEPLSQNRKTLREHYAEKQDRFGSTYPDFYDRDLRRLFAGAPGQRDLPRASTFLRRVAPELRRVVSRWTGEYEYTIDMPLKEMIKRCRELDLRLDRSPDVAKLEAAVLLTMQTTNFIHSTTHRLPM